MTPILTSTATPLQTRQLSCVKGRRPLFADIDIDLQQGSALHVRGGNGSGKTSLLRLLCGLATPAGGKVLWQGQDIRLARENFNENLLMLGHANAVKDDLLTWENLVFNARLAGLCCDRHQACAILKKMGLAHLAQLPTGNLSQGQRKRLALARLYMDQWPSLLILDEAFAALDVSAIDSLIARLDQHLDLGGMLVYTTHQDIHLKHASRQELWLGAPAC